MPDVDQVGLDRTPSFGIGPNYVRNVIVDTETPIPASEDEAVSREDLYREAGYGVPLTSEGRSLDHENARTRVGQTGGTLYIRR